MGSQRQATQLPGNPALPIMDINLDFLKPVYELVQNEEVQKKLDETARLYWSPDVDSNTVTVNLIPSIIVLIIAALVALPLLGVPIFGLLGDSLKGVGVGGGGYGAPSSGYGAPSSDYGAPSSGYGAPSHGRSDIAYYEQSIADLQQQVASLQGSTYYNSPVGDGAQDINGVGYSS